MRERRNTGALQGIEPRCRSPDADTLETPEQIPHENPLSLPSPSPPPAVAAPLAAHAQALDKGGFFLNGSVGKTNVDDGLYDDDDTGFGANIGYRWSAGPGAAFGIEGGYQNLGEWSPVLRASPAGDALGKAELKGWTAGVNGHFNVSDNWYIAGRAGLFRADLEGDYLDGDVIRRR